jgi:hypothetical protein
VNTTSSQPRERLGSSRAPARRAPVPHRGHAPTAWYGVEVRAWSRFARVVLFAASAVSAASLASCSLLTSSDGLAGVPTIDGAVDDGAVRSVPDAAARDSGEVDANDDAPVATGASFCAHLSPAPLFCDDFDELPLATSWDSVVAAEGVVALYADDSRSPPRSMWVTTSTQSDLALQAFVVKAFAPWTARPMTATLDVDVRVDRATATDVPLVAIQLLEASGKLYEVQLRASGAGASLTTTFREHTRDGTSDAVSDRGLADTVLVNAWTHVRVELTYRIVAGSRARVSIDGVIALDAPVSPSTLGGTPRVALGITRVYGPTEPWAVRYDNAVFDAVP